jgi:hypothetical protein
MATRNISDHRIEAAPLAGTLAARWRRLKISPSSVYSAVVLILVVGVAVLFRGFV